MFYVEYYFNVLDDDSESGDMHITYITLKLCSNAHLSILEDIRTEGLRAYGNTYTIKRFLDDLAKRGVWFEIIVPSVVIDFDTLPEQTDLKSNGSFIKIRDEYRPEIM